MEQLQKALRVLWGLNVLDIVTTAIVLALGGGEVNPIMGLLYNSFFLTILYKVIILLTISYLYIRGYKEGEKTSKRVIWCLNGFFGLVSLVNIYNLIFLYAAK